MTITKYKGRELVTRVTNSYQQPGMMLVTVGVGRADGVRDAGLACGFEEICDAESIPMFIRELQESATRWIDQLA